MTELPEGMAPCTYYEYRALQDRVDVLELMVECVLAGMGYDAARGYCTEARGDGGDAGDGGPDDGNNGCHESLERRGDQCCYGTTCVPQTDTEAQAKFYDCLEQVKDYDPATGQCKDSSTEPQLPGGNPCTVYNLEDQFDEFTAAFGAWRDRIWLISDGGLVVVLMRSSVPPDVRSVRT